MRVAPEKIAGDHDTALLICGELSAKALGTYRAAVATSARDRSET